jgi:hypothetical protein
MYIIKTIVKIRINIRIKIIKLVLNSTVYDSKSKSQSDCVLHSKGGLGVAVRWRFFYPTTTAHIPTSPFIPLDELGTFGTQSSTSGAWQYLGCLGILVIDTTGFLVLFSLHSNNLSPGH